MDFEAILTKANRGFGKKQCDGYVAWDDAIEAMETVAKAKTVPEKDKTFVRIINAASYLGDGRSRHIRAYKHLVRIIERLSPGILAKPKKA